MDPRERRRYPRMPLDLVTSLKSVPLKLSEDVLPSAIRDISSGGVFIETDTDAAVGSLIMIRLELPSEERRRSVFGLVKWRRLQPRGIGVQFMALKPTRIDAVEKYLGSLEQEPTPEED